LNFTPKDALKIIKQAKKLGVISMKIGNLEFELADNTLARSRPALKVSKKEIVESDSKNQAQFDFETAKDELSVMHVEDPMGFERALIETELDTDGEGNNLEETYGQPVT
jgi:hypothetical protein